MVVGIGPIAFVMLLPGLILPLDGAGGILMMVVSLPLVPVALGYVYLGCGVLPNTVGRWLVGIRVRDEATGERPGLKQALLRALPMGLWPVEALMIAFSDSKRRMGDRLAGTVVERYDPGISRWARLGWIGGGLAGAYALILVLSVGVVARMDVTRAATEYAEQELGGRRGLARYAAVEGDAGWVTLDSGASGPVRIHLERTDGAWRVMDVRGIPESEFGRGFHVETVEAEV